MFRNLLFASMVFALLVGAAQAVERGPVVHPNHPEDHHDPAPGQAALDCGQCHECAHPTKDEPCMAPCPRHANNFHSDQKSIDSPDVLVIDQLAEHYEPVVFAHGLHARMSDMTGGCTNCHHYSEDSGKIPACRECHDETKGPVDLRKPGLKGAYHRQCMNCHKDWSHANACGFCHESHDESTPIAPVDSTDIVGHLHPMITATDSYFYETDCEDGAIVSFHHTDHVEMFGLNCVDCHRGDTCGSCHDQTNHKPKSLDHLVECCQCHKEEGCDFCHTDEKQPRFDHEMSTGWALNRFHGEVDCATCHGQPQDFRTPDHMCTSCHIHWEEGDFDHSVTGVVFNEDHEDMDCTDCHYDMDFQVKPSCDDCHDDERTYDPKTGFGG